MKSNYMKAVIFTLCLISLMLPVSNAQAALECSIGEIKQWESGFAVRDVTVYNNSNRVLNSPSVRLVFKQEVRVQSAWGAVAEACLLYTSPSPRDRQKSRMPSSA